MATQKKPRRKSIQNSDPGKIMDLVMSLSDDTCALLQIKINAYLSEECEAELVLQLIVNGDRMEATLEAVGEIGLPRKRQICMTPKLCDVLKSPMEQTDLLTNFGQDFQSIVGPVASLKTLLHIAMDQAKALTKAEYCSVMLVDVDRMELVDTGPPTKDDKEVLERRFPLDIGIAGQVIKSGSLINAKSAKEHPEFNADIDGYPGIDCRTILCFPIREQTGIIGVGQLINKIGDPYFDGMDEEMALAFSIYCGVCIMHSVVYQKIQEAHVRNILANELVMYHMKVQHEDSQACPLYPLREEGIPRRAVPQLAACFQRRPVGLCCYCQL